MGAAEVDTFPTDFADSPEVLKDGISRQADAAINELSERGFVVATGLSRKMLPAIQAMAGQDHIRRYCWRDISEDRFATEESTANWLGKGRAFFVLAKQAEDGELHPVGYGWSGPASTAEVPGGETTWAVRLGEEAVGQRLSGPFSRVIVDATQQLFGGDNLYLEAWESNGAGLHTYGKLGFELVAKKAAQRPELDGKMVDDTRIFMKL